MAYEFTDASFKEEVLDNEKVTLDDFWAEIRGRASNIGAGELAVTVKLLDEAKVEDLDHVWHIAALAEHDVGGLDVSMD